MSPASFNAFKCWLTVDCARGRSLTNSPQMHSFFFARMRKIADPRRMRERSREICELNVFVREFKISWQGHTAILYRRSTMMRASDGNRSDPFGQSAVPISVGSSIASPLVRRPIPDSMDLHGDGPWFASWICVSRHRAAPFETERRIDVYPYRDRSCAYDVSPSCSSSL